MQNRRQFVLSSAMLCMGPAILLGRVEAAIPILRVGGAAFGTRPPMALDLAAMDALPQTRFRTTTPWHEGSVEFSGVTLEDLVASAGVEARELQLIALNDYAVDADLSELIEAGALLATRQNGEPMPVTDKGPVFVAFPFDDRPELRHQTYYSRSVWQLTEIVLR
ncbi:MAG: molybdopterin-dependent oxidoreductase [Methylobacterium sp.]